MEIIDRKILEKEMSACGDEIRALRKKIREESEYLASSGHNFSGQSLLGFSNSIQQLIIHLCAVEKQRGAWVKALELFDSQSKRE